MSSVSASPASRLSVQLALLLLTLALVAHIRHLPLSDAIWATLLDERIVELTGGQVDEDALARLEVAKTLVGDDGRLYPLLPETDAYYWLRAAQRIVEGGAPCDEVIDGLCRDTRSLAPVGLDVSYGHSLHPHALAALYQAIQPWAPGVPLIALAIWLPLLLGLLGTLPAYALGRRLGGSAGGITAALMTGLSPVYLGRSGYGDNDVWNVVLPLFALWAIVRACAARSIAARLGWTVGAAACIGMHALAWSGWPFGAGVIVGGLVAAAGLRLGDDAAGGRGVVALLSTALCFAAFTACLVGLAAALNPFVSVPGLPAFWQSTGPAAHVEPGLWPNAFATVEELVPVTYELLTRQLGAAWLPLSMAGLYLCAMPRRRLLPADFAVLAVIFPGAFLLPRVSAPGAPLMLAFFGLVFAAGLARRWRLRAAADPSSLVLACLLGAAWLGAWFMIRTGQRFLLLAVVPYGLLNTVLVGRVVGEVVARGWRPLFAGAITASVMLALLVPTFTAGRRALLERLPQIDSAWWESFAALRSAPPDAIITTSWDFGHLAKFASDRRTTSDGATLRTHVNHWFARLLMSSDETESAGLLRMLNCGSDAVPLAEGSHGAFARLRAAGLADIDIVPLIVDLAARDRKAAQVLLAARSLQEEDVTAVLAATHCAAPPSYLVLASSFLRLGMMWRSGLWDIARADAIARQRRGEEVDAEALATRSFDGDLVAARGFLTRVAASDEDPDLLASPPLTPFAEDWTRCKPKAEGTYRCNIPVFDVPPHWRGARYEYRVGAETAGTLFVADARGRTASGTVGSVLIARPDGLEEVQHADATYPDSAVLIDPALQQVYFGPPYLLRSLLVQMVLLDGRYLRQFERVDSRESLSDGTVSTWRVKGVVGSR